MKTENHNKLVETLCLCRVSSDKQAKKETITSQKQACLNYAKHNGFIIDKFFDEDGVSARKYNRPGLDAMVEYIVANTFAFCAMICRACHAMWDFIMTGLKISL